MAHPRPSVARTGQIETRSPGSGRPEHRSCRIHHCPEDAHARVERRRRVLRTFDPPHWWCRRRTLSLEVIELNGDSVLEEVVRSWVEEVLPGEAGIADRAAALAIDSYEAGASVQAVCTKVSELVHCWALHPSTQKVSGHALVGLAS